MQDRSEENSLQLMNLNRFKNSKDAFWIYTTQRLIELCDYHLANPENLILHVESDVILMDNFPFEHLQRHKRMLWGNYNSTHDVASLLFLPNAKLTAKFKKLILHFLIEDQSVSDMTLLSIIAGQLPDEHSYFPSIPSDNSILINAAYTPKDFELESQSRLFDSFGGVFDHQMVGMYLDGLNPEQTYGYKETLFTKVVESGESLIDQDM